jgi:hypothetical protein
MARNLWLVANATGSDAQLTSTQSQSDNTPVPGSQITHTGGKDNDFIAIPHCSASEYFANHHITIQAGANWTVALWTDDDDNYKLYWAAGNFYSTQNPVSDSVNYDNCGIIITGSGNNVTVSVSEWYGCS